MLLRAHRLHPDDACRFATFTTCRRENSFWFRPRDRLPIIYRSQKGGRFRTVVDQARRCIFGTWRRLVRSVYFLHTAGRVHRQENQSLDLRVYRCEHGVTRIEGCCFAYDEVNGTMGPVIQ